MIDSEHLWSTYNIYFRIFVEIIQNKPSPSYSFRLWHMLCVHVCGFAQQAGVEVNDLCWYRSTASGVHTGVLPAVVNTRTRAEYIRARFVITFLCVRLMLLWEWLICGEFRQKSVHPKFLDILDNYELSQLLTNDINCDVTSGHIFTNLCWATKQCSNKMLLRFCCISKSFTQYTNFQLKHKVLRCVCSKWNISM